jgi:apolipoprotein D and lipocalin family protein
VSKFLTLVVGAAAASLIIAGPAIGLPARGAGKTPTGLPPITPVASVNLPEYLGKWFQVAAIPEIFEAACVKDATADYTLAADGNLSVANDCTTRNDGIYEVTGEARSDNAPADSTLTVSFIDFFGLKFFSATPNYDIIGLDPSYQWAVVASPNRLSAFILSRTPTLTSPQVAITQAVLSDNEINPCFLQVTVQDGGATSPTQYCRATELGE